jgi:hypothetical protein
MIEIETTTIRIKQKHAKNEILETTQPMGVVVSSVVTTIY